MLIYCIRLLCDWSFPLQHYIIYIRYVVASCLFLLWYNQSLLRYFLLLFEQIQFLSLGFSFLSHIQDSVCLLLEIAIQFFFLPIFCFQANFVLWKRVLSVLFLVSVISLFQCFSLSSSSLCMNVSTLSCMLVIPFQPSFFDTFSLSTSPPRCIIIFSFLLSICWTSLVHFKNGRECHMR